MIWFCGLSYAAPNARILLACIRHSIDNQLASKELQKVFPSFPNKQTNNINIWFGQITIFNAVTCHFHLIHTLKKKTNNESNSHSKSKSNRWAFLCAQDSRLVSGLCAVIQLSPWELFFSIFLIRKCTEWMNEWKICFRFIYIFQIPDLLSSRWTKYQVNGNACRNKYRNNIRCSISIAFDAHMQTTIRGSCAWQRGQNTFFLLCNIHYDSRSIFTLIECSPFTAKIQFFQKWRQNQCVEHFNAATVSRLLWTLATRAWTTDNIVPTLDYICFFWLYSTALAFVLCISFTRPASSHSIVKRSIL